MAVGATAAKAENAANAGGGNGDGVARVGARSDDSDDEMARGEDAAAAEVLDELEKEVGIMARLRHPNIVLLLGAVRSPPAIVEEFCARGSRSSPCSSDTPNPAFRRLRWRVRLQMALGAAAGMCYLHNCAPPIVHRDLKSPNLMVDRYFRVKVGDFNLQSRRGGVRGLQSRRDEPRIFSRRVALAAVDGAGGVAVGGVHARVRQCTRSRWCCGSFDRCRGPGRRWVSGR